MGESYLAPIGQGRSGAVRVSRGSVRGATGASGASATGADAVRGRAGAGAGGGQRGAGDRSGVVAEGGPGRGPGGPEAGGQIDRHTLFVVVDAEAVAEGGDLADVSELPAEQAGVDVDRD